MVNHCANPECCKPLHYLREGRIFVFDIPDPALPAKNGKVTARMEHFWLCGVCSEGFTLEQTAEKNVRLTPKALPQMRAPISIRPTALAS